MRLSFTLLVAVASTIVASIDALPVNTDSDLTTSPSSGQSATTGQIGSKRFLRSHRDANEGVDGKDEERGVITDPRRSMMLLDSAYKKTVFNNWLKNNVSSFTIRDYLKLDDKWKLKYQNLYNEYARLHKASGQYP